MGQTVKNLASLQFALFMIPLLVFLWAWGLWLAISGGHGLITTGLASPAALGFLLVGALLIAIATPLTYVESQILRSSFKQYNTAQLAMNIIFFLGISGFIGTSYNYIHYLPFFTSSLN